MLPVTMGLFDTTCGRGALAGSLGGQLLTRSLSSSGLTSSLLGTSHYDRVSPDGIQKTPNNVSVSIHFIMTLIVAHWTNDPAKLVALNSDK